MRENILTCVLIFTYFVFWALVKPPFQAPDEYAHYVRYLSIKSGLYVLPGLPVQNIELKVNAVIKLYNDPVLERITGRDYVQEQKLNDTELEYLLNIKSESAIRAQSYTTTAAAYPAIYYLLLHYCENITSNFIAPQSEYSIFLLLRILTCFLAACLWILVKINLTQVGLSNYLLTWLLLNPMVPFLSSSINPDSILIPCGLLVMIYSYKYHCRGSLAAGMWFCTLICNLIKPAALVLYPTLILLEGIYFKHKTRPAIYQSAGIGGVSLLVLYFLRLKWSPPILQFHGAKPADVSMFEYVSLLWTRLPDFLSGYWGALGWMQFGLQIYFYWVATIFACFGIILTFMRPRCLDQYMFSKFSCIYFFLYIAFTIGVDYYWYDVVGSQFQGRYALPAALGLAICMNCRSHRYQFTFISYLILLNFLLLNASVNFYFSSSWGAIGLIVKNIFI